MDRREARIVDISDLGTITRILFATDGTITHILEAYAGEAVELVTITSAVVSGSPNGDDLATADEGRTLRRRCLLRGCDSRRVFVHADSAVRLDRIPEPVAEALAQPGTSLLSLLTRHRVGTFREGVSEWEGNDEAIAACFAVDPGDLLVARTYQVVLGGQPVAWVTETFPKHGFSAPPACPKAPRSRG